MARRTQHALQRQLKRERAHLRWLQQHLPQSMQLSLSKERIAKLAAQSAILSDSKQKKSAAYTTLFPKSYEQLSLLSSPSQLLRSWFWCNHCVCWLCCWC